MTLPVNQGSEKYVLGGCIEESAILTAVLAAGLTPEDFSLSVHARFFRALTEMRAEEIPVDLISVAEFIGNDDRDVAILADCVSGVVIQRAHILHHASIIRKKARLRNLLHLAEELLETAAGPHADPDQIVLMVAMKLSEAPTRLQARLEPE